MPVAHLPMFSVEFSREMIPVETMSPARVPDPNWQYVDAQGHGHFRRDLDYPTLEWVVTGREWVGDEIDGCEVPIGEWRCRSCAEVIEPGLKNEYQGPIPGPATFTVFMDGEFFSLTEEGYRQSLESWREALRLHAHHIRKEGSL